MKIDNIDHLTFDGEIRAVYNNFKDDKIFVPVDLWVMYSVEKNGETTTVSLSPNKGETMITFNYQDLKKLVEGKNNGKIN